MKRTFSLLLLLLAAPLLLPAQSQDVKLMIDTIVVQAEGTYEADPDLATLTFVVFAEDKKLTRAYELATNGLKRIVELAERNKVAKTDVSSSVFSVTPDYSGKKTARSYRVQTTVTVKVRDLSRVAFVIDDAVESGVAEFRSAAYTLADEETAKQKAVAEAMRRAQQRARVAVGENGRRLGELRHASLDIKMSHPFRVDGLETVAFLAAGVTAPQPSPPPPPLAEISPEKITITATAQCVYQIQ